MSYWKYGTEQNNAPAISGYEIGSTLDFQLTFVNDEETLPDAYVFVPEEYFNLLQIKLPDESDEDWRPIYGVLDGTGSVGDLPVGETLIDFRLQVVDPLLDINVLRIPISIGYNDGATNSISFLWQYRDLLDYVYPGDDQDTWIHPDGPGDNCDDWRLWADCPANQNIWRDSYSSGRNVCDYEADSDSFISGPTPAHFQSSGGSPWL